MTYFLLSDEVIGHVVFHIISIYGKVREREGFYLTPVGPGRGHMAADTAEKRL